MKTIYQQLDIPEERKNVSVSEKEAEYIYEFLKKKKIKKTLEVGFAYGCSAAYIISATKSKHYVIDPFQVSFENLGLKNIKKLKLEKFLVFETDFSHFALPKLLKDNLKVDFTFIDGAHKFDSIFIDFYFVDLILNQQGYVLFDDAWMRATQHVVSWILRNKKNYKIIKTPIRNFILLQKIGEDKRLWYKFKRFCTMKAFFQIYVLV